MRNINKYVALFVLRTLLGVIFFLQGFGKIFKYGLESLYSNVFETYESILPKFIVVGVAYYTSYVEMIAGFLLIIGFWKSYALYALGSVLLVVSIGHGMMSPIWELDHVMYRAMLLVTILLLPEEWDKWQLEKLIKGNNRKDEINH